MKGQWRIVESDNGSSDGEAAEFICVSNDANEQQDAFIARSQYTSSTAC